MIPLSKKLNTGTEVAYPISMYDNYTLYTSCWVYCYNKWYMTELIKGQKALPNSDKLLVLLGF